MIKLMPDGSISQQKTQIKQPFAWLGLAFRPFFLLGSLFSIVSLLIWVSFMTGVFQFSPFGSATWWHIHEMLFGFVAAIIVGFLLTAVKTWTGQKGFSGSKLLLLVLLWLSARVLLLIPSLVPLWLASAIDLLFLPISALILAMPIVKVKLWRNLAFIPLLLIMSYANGMMHCSVYINSPSHLYLASTSMVLIITFIMCMMGGRVFPMFTANGTQTQRVNALPWLEKFSLGSLLLIVLVTIFQIPLPQWLLVSLYFISAALHLVRGLRWRIWVTLKTPLVWSLHVSYLCIPVGLALLGTAELSALISKSQAIHVITVGAMGLMILSMVSRVSLGHTGRMIIATNIVNVSFIMLVLAMVARVFGPLIFNNYSITLMVAALLWCLGYGIFVLKYFPILISKRIDGKEG